MPQEYEQINVGERTHKGKSKIRALRRDGKIREYITIMGKKMLI